MKNDTQQTQEKKVAGVGREKIATVLARLGPRDGDLLRRLAE